MKIWHHFFKWRGSNPQKSLTFIPFLGSEQFSVNVVNCEWRWEGRVWCWNLQNCCVKTTISVYECWALSIFIRFSTLHRWFFFCPNDLSIQSLKKTKLYYLDFCSKNRKSSFFCKDDCVIKNKMSGTGSFWEHSLILSLNGLFKQTIWDGLLL